MYGKEKNNGPGGQDMIKTTLLGHAKCHLLFSIVLIM